MHRNNSPFERLRRFDIDLDADFVMGDFFVMAIGGGIIGGTLVAAGVETEIGMEGGEENSGVGTPVLAGSMVVGAGSGGRFSGAAATDVL